MRDWFFIRKEQKLRSLQEGEIFFKKAFFGKVFFAKKD